MKKLLIIIILFTESSPKLSAQLQQISLEEAKEAAISRVTSQKSVVRSDVSVTAVSYCENSNGDVLIYEVATNKGLTILLSGNRQCKPILGVHGNNDGMLLSKFDSLPCSMKYLFDSYKSQINNCFYDSVVDSRHRDEWASLITGEQSPTIRTEYVPPLLSSLWDQRNPNNTIGIDAYNCLIPSGNNCEHCPAGCVAVAMGQIMYYWKYPVLIKSWDIQFDWCNMDDSLYTYDPLYQKKKNAISYLLLECGESVNMDYECTGSSANTEDARDALVEKFKYSNTADYKSRFWYSDEEWKTMLRTNIDSSMPVIYRGRTALIGGDGHAFVIDGYNQNDEFHVNWGWGDGFSGADTYFTLDNLQPNISNYQYYQGAIFGIKPAETQGYCDITLCLDAFYGEHTSHSHPLYTSTPKTMATLISAPSSSPASYRTIPTGAVAEYVAHEEIVLQPGFTAEYGSDFTARIESCAACEGRMVQMEHVPHPDSSNETDINAQQTVFLSGDSVFALSESPFSLFPNPNNGLLTVNSPEEVVKISIFNQMGKSVHRWFIASRSEKSMTLNVENLPSGTYILHITTKNGKTHAGRFVRQ